MARPLDEYKRKRDFTKTPEPAGTVKPREGRELFFCVQKHLASQLHYDLRLEHNGVLLSWAVPKGPSLDPKTKRLAMHVEDHPFDYGEFEGVIPEGYGAGIVMLWDRGTWTPESSDVDAALKKGDLKFTLNGYKLKGSWVLVRTRGWGSKKDAGSGDQSRSWLLIKHADAWSGEVDITTFAPNSVKTGGDFEDILGQDMPAVWRSNRPAKSGDAGAMFARLLGRAETLRVDTGKEKARKAAGKRIPPARTSGMKKHAKRRPSKAR
jgi:bifunctional non-homologous end joining protein LigD